MVGHPRLVWRRLEAGAAISRKVVALGDPVVAEAAALVEAADVVAAVDLRGDAAADLVAEDPVGRVDRAAIASPT